MRPGVGVGGADPGWEFVPGVTDREPPGSLWLRLFRIGESNRTGPTTLSDVLSRRGGVMKGLCAGGAAFDWVDVFVSGATKNGFAARDSTI